jgi:hypothetical protein
MTTSAGAGTRASFGSDLPQHSLVDWPINLYALVLSVNGSRKLKGSLLTGLDQAYRLRKLYLFFSICSPTLPVPGLLAGLPLLCQERHTTDG